MRKVVGHCPGTCGELIEGKWQGKQLLVSLPVDLFSTVAVSDKEGAFAVAGSEKSENFGQKYAKTIEKSAELITGTRQGGRSKQSIDKQSVDKQSIDKEESERKSNRTNKERPQGESDLKRNRPKSWRALSLLAEERGFSREKIEDLHFCLCSELPVGKGMSSSTADLCASMGALAGFFGQQIDAREGTRFCQRIEATDSLLFSSLTLLEENDSSIIQESGWSPDFSILLLEPDSQLNTDQFYNADTDQLFSRQESDFLQVLELYDQAVESRSLDLLGQAATLSSQLNQDISPKPYFDTLLRIKDQFPVFGIVVAHSGTVVGLMMKNEEIANRPGLLKQIKGVMAQSGIFSFYQKIRLLHTCYNGLVVSVSDDD